jgi:hypothetical protein
MARDSALWWRLRRPSARPPARDRAACDLPLVALHRRTDVYLRPPHLLPATRPARSSQPR